MRKVQKRLDEVMVVFIFQTKLLLMAHQPRLIVGDISKALVTSLRQPAWPLLIKPIVLIASPTTIEVLESWRQSNEVIIVDSYWGS